MYNNDDNADTGNAPTLNICFENTIIIEKNDNKMDIDINEIIEKKMDIKENKMIEKKMDNKLNNIRNR